MKGEGSLNDWGLSVTEAGNKCNIDRHTRNSVDKCHTNTDTNDRGLVAIWGLTVGY